MKAKLIISILICEMAGVAGSIFTTPAIPTWYEGLVKPSFVPPSWLFAPVWITLYLLMGIAFYLVWKDERVNPSVRGGVLLFSSQLVLNILWSYLFFGLQSPLYGLIDIVLLWIFIVLTTIQFKKVSKTAFLLMLPYLLWVSFAAVLNFFIWRLN
jgi:benzodiazapine receptor